MIRDVPAKLVVSVLVTVVVLKESIVFVDVTDTTEVRNDPKALPFSSFLEFCSSIEEAISGWTSLFLTSSNVALLAMILSIE